MNPALTESAAAALASLDWAHPLVREWFLRRLGTPTEPQEQGWPHILAGKTTLISAPTGSGKTLAAFLACIDRLVRKALAGELTDRLEVLYVSPLKALGNDIQKNLEIPLGEILQLAAERGFLMPEIRTAVRTGDTLMHERRAMLKRPPHILVTTPGIALHFADRREEPRNSAQLSKPSSWTKFTPSPTTSAARIWRFHSNDWKRSPTGRPLRIGLSATQKPIELIAHFLDRQRPS